MTRHEAASTACPVVEQRTSETARRPVAPTMTSDKIHSYHWDRLAVVYVRQSSPHQVLEHRESKERQYALVNRAVELGWPTERVLVIDEDQGQSGKTAENRTGFQRLLVEVNLDHVGLILGLEMSRLARSNKDWHHLLEVCAIFRTLLADADGIYDANDPNDRMLLGLKGTISEVELHTLRSRLTQGILNKARRGEFFTVVPIGYVRLPDDEIAFDPDEQVQSIVRLISEKFAELGSASAVLKYLVKHRIRIGVRRRNGRVTGPVEWSRPSYSTILTLLHNPIYAGAYCRGRRTSDPRRKGIHHRAHQKMLPIDEWEILLPDVLPAYITWDQYMANLETLKSNHARMERMGSARNGSALLPGLLRCGHCGARMVVTYKGDGIRYSCHRQAIGFAEKPCQHFKGNPVEELVQEKVLRALEPAALELSLKAAADIQHEQDRLHHNWQQRLERAHYETERAQRQYDAVEPENRLVARELEQRWESALRDWRQLQEEYDRFCQSQPQTLSQEDIARIQSLASEIPKIWHAEETTPQDRKIIVRHLIDRAVAKAEGEYISVTIHWAGGYISEHEVMHPLGSFRRMQDFDRFKRRVLELHFEGRSWPQICEQLIKEKFHSPHGLDYFSPANLRSFVRRYCTEEELGPNWGSFGEYLRADEWLVGDLSRRLDIPKSTLHYWRRRGWLHGRQLRPNGGRWIFWADEDELTRLQKLRACPINCAQQGEPYPAELITPKLLPSRPL